MTTQFSEVEIEVLVEDYFTKNVAECPRCQHELNVQEGGPTGRPRVSLLFQCLRCLASGQYDRTAEQPERRWTETECQQLMADADGGRQLRCPLDNTLMWAKEPRGNLGAPIERTIICRQCGNMHRFKLTARAEVDA
jgi:hypothetical protein